MDKTKGIEKIDINDLQINVQTNIPGKNTFIITKDLLYHPELDTNEEKLNKYPYLVSNYVYPNSVLAGMNYKDVVSFFFNKKRMISVIQAQNSKPRKDIETVEKENIHSMMKTLFATKYFIVKNIHQSVESIDITKTMPKSFFFDPRRLRFTYLKLDDVYTITKVVWVNDILNHPNYSKLVSKVASINKKMLDYGEHNKDKEEDIENKEDKEEESTGHEQVIRHKLGLKNKESIPYVFHNFIYDELDNYTKTSNRNVNRYISGNHEFQKLIEKDPANFYEEMSKFYNHYFNNTTDSPNKKYLYTGVTNVDTSREGVPAKNIYLLIDCIKGEVNDENKKEVYCPYTNEYLGNILERMFFPYTEYSWKIDNADYMYSVKQSEVKNNIQEKKVVEEEKQEKEKIEKSIQPKKELSVDTEKWKSFINIFNNDELNRYVGIVSQTQHRNPINFLPDNTKLKGLIKQASGFYQELDSQEKTDMIMELKKELSGFKSMIDSLRTIRKRKIYYDKGQTNKTLQAHIIYYLITKLAIEALDKDEKIEPITDISEFP